MNQARRRLITAGAAASLCWLASPRDAKAAWMMAASLALSAASAFTRSDSGMGAMLSALKELQEENIRLTQQVLSSLAEVQRSLAQLPSLLRETLRESAEFRVREETTDVFNRLLYLERERREGRQYRAEAFDLVERCVSISRFQSVPHGIGGVGAICAPIAVSVDARARRLAGREASVNNAIETFYLPWFRAIRSTQEGALLGRTLQIAGQLNDEIASVSGSLSNRSKGVLQEFLKRAVGLDAGAPPIESIVECVRVQHHVRTDTPCVEYDEVGGSLPVSFKPDAEAATPEKFDDGVMSSRLLALRICVRRGEVPVYQPGQTLDRILSAENKFVPLGVAQASDAGPQLAVSSRWVKAADTTKVCPGVISRVNVTQPADIAGFIEASDLKAWEADLTAFNQSKVATINDLRQQLYAMHYLLTNARESENLLQKVVQ